MNMIRKSMEEIRASEELKKNTMEYLRRQQRRIRFKRVRRYALAAACLCLFLIAGGYNIYVKPVSYISIDVNPSVELGINRFGRVVEADAYNADGQEMLKRETLKHMPYLKAIDRLLKGERRLGYLTEDSRVYITVISGSWELILEEIRTDKIAGKYGARTYTSDLTCREEAHRKEMSFGKYRACLELSQYDESVTVEDCHGMSMGEIEDRIETCKGHQGKTGHGGKGHENYEDYEENEEYENYRDYEENEENENYRDYEENEDHENHERHHGHGH